MIAAPAGSVCRMALRPEDFYTVARASAGVRVDLIDPDGNKEWVQVRSVASDEFSAAVRQVALLAIEAEKGPELSPTDRKYAIRRNRAFMTASLVADSSFDMPLIDLMTTNPKLRRQIERIAEDDSLHFGVTHD